MLQIIERTREYIQTTQDYVTKRIQNMRAEYNLFLDIVPYKIQIYNVIRENQKIIGTSKGIELSNIDTVYREVAFDPSDVDERELYIGMLSKILEMMYSDYSTCIKYIYTNTEAYIKENVGVENTAHNFNKFKSSLRGHGEIYIMIKFLEKIKKVQLTEEENDLIKYWDKWLRKLRNEFTHTTNGMLDKPKSRRLSEELLENKDITLNLQEIDHIHQTIINIYLDSMKDLLLVFCTKLV